MGQAILLLIGGAYLCFCFVCPIGFVPLVGIGILALMTKSVNKERREIKQEAEIMGIEDDHAFLLRMKSMYDVDFDKFKVYLGQHLQENRRLKSLIGG